MTEEEKDELRTALAAWIDTFTIADVLIEECQKLVEDGDIPEVNMHSCQKLWLLKLENL